jgi:hypothetical protein
LPVILPVSTLRTHELCAKALLTANKTTASAFMGHFQAHHFLEGLLLVMAKVIPPSDEGVLALVIAATSRMFVNRMNSPCGNGSLPITR